MAEIKKGSRVKCIDGDFSKYDASKIYGISFPEECVIYTTREVIKTGGQEAILVEEVRNNRVGSYEPAFLKYRFAYHSE